MSTAPEPSWWQPTDDVISTDELIRRAGATAFTSFNDLVNDDPFVDDEEYEAFLADLRDSRRSDVA